MMEVIKQLFIATGSSLLTAFFLWLVSRYRPIADWILQHRIAASLIGIVLIYLAGLTATIEMILSMEQKLNTLAIWSTDVHQTTAKVLNCPENTYVTAVQMPVINNAGFVGQGSLTCRPLNLK
jgi:hypothetical protein